jgi:hypothetical protein
VTRPNAILDSRADAVPVAGDAVHAGLHAPLDVTHLPAQRCERTMIEWNGCSIASSPI